MAKQKPPRLSKAMRAIQKQKKKRDAYLASPEHAEHRRTHAQWLKDAGFSAEAITKYTTPRERVRTRRRRGKIVEIPEVWQGVVTYPQTIRKRNPVSRRTRKEHK